MGVVVDPDRLETAVAAIFRAAGSPEREAGLIARHLVEADLRGHGSHGIGVVPGYVAAAARGDLVLGRDLAVILDSGALLLCDGGRGAGQVMAHDAMALAAARARRDGACVLALRDSYHIGRIGHWAEQCAAAGLVSVHFVNVPGAAVVAAFGGTAGRLGTNPFAAGFPRPGADPIVVDFATSRLAYGKVRVALNKGEPVPPGTILDAAGRPSTDPADLFADPPGVLLPFGEHKGFGLALACELLAGALTGGRTQSGTPDLMLNSMLSNVVSPEALGTAGSFSESLETLVAWVRSEQGVRLPGEPEAETRARRLREGIPIDATTWAALQAAAASLGLDAGLV
jgi:hydroxycarboxylate dehydrogenase B